LPNTILEARNVEKAFGPTVALSGVSFAVAAGRVHALIGENGAGKSTLMGILAGAIAQDRGELTLGGAPFAPRKPDDARRAGIAMVHQELSLCPHLSVEENIALGSEPTRFGVVLRSARRRYAREAIERLGGAELASRLPLDARAGDLSPAAQQLVEIARALALPGRRVLILDEPTSSLGAEDVERLFAVLRAAKSDGIAVVYISHFLEEIHRVADDFTVLRDGRTAGNGSIADVAPSDIVAMMAGRPAFELFPRSARAPGDVVLEVRGLSGGKPADVTFELRRGEVLGIAGLVGAGRTELLRCIFGLDPVKSGAIRVAGVSGFRPPHARIAQGVGFLSEDRKSEGLATSLSIADNLTLSNMDSLGPRGLALPKKKRQAAARLLDKLSIRARDPDQRTSELSGGNQQKVALARLLHQEADLFLLDEPTRGIDVGSKAQIYELIDELASSGKAVLVVSSYLPELFGICDRIAVMRRGRLGPARPASELDAHSVLAEAAGA
jgi:ribose transport system ATP-binding protein